MFLNQKSSAARVGGGAGCTLVGVVVTFVTFCILVVFGVFVKSGVWWGMCSGIQTCCLVVLRLGA